MEVELRKIGNSRGIILPRHVACRLTGGGNERLEGAQKADGVDANRMLELTVIGATVVLGPTTPDESDIVAALAFAEVKRRRKQLLRRMAERDRQRLGKRVGSYYFYDKFELLDDDATGRR